MFIATTLPSDTALGRTVGVHLGFGIPGMELVEQPTFCRLGWGWFESKDVNGFPLPDDSPAREDREQS